MADLQFSESIKLQYVGPAICPHDHMWIPKKGCFRTADTPCAKCGTLTCGNHAWKGSHKSNRICVDCMEQDPTSEIYLTTEE